jgi:hypothetical protein
MTRITRIFLMAAVMAAAISLTPSISNEAVAQITISVPGVTRSYYNGYGTHYRPAIGYRHSGRAYSAYGNGPYGYGSAVPFGYPSSGYPYSGGYGFRTGTSYSTYFGGSYLRGGSYRPVYVPHSTRYYVPYGYGYRG